MSNKRIKELPILASPSSKEDYLIIDPTSGGTSKISLEQAILNTEFAKAGGAAGAPFVKVAVGTQITVANIFASSSVVTGVVYFRVSAIMGTLLFSKNKDSSTMNCFFSNPDRGTGAFDLAIQGGDPQNGKDLRKVPWSGSYVKSLIRGRGMYIMFATNGIGYWGGGSPYGPIGTQVSYWIVES